MAKSAIAMSKTLITKINIGDGLTKQELECALSFYNMVSENLRLLGSEFNLAWREVNSTLSRLEGFQRARDRG